MKIYELKHIRHYNESVNLYTAKNVLRGVHRDGERYTLVVTEPNLDEGTGPEAVTVLNTIDWDNVFYIYWERPNGPVEYYVITVTDSSDNEVAIIEVDANTTNYTIDGRSEEGNPSNITLTNGETYTIVVEVVLFNSSIGSTEFTATPVDVTVSTPTLGAVTANTAEISWAVPNGDVGSYTIQVTNEDISTVEQTITGIEGTSAEIYGLTKDVNYSIRVKAVSEQDLFESDWSASVEFVATNKPDAPENFAVEVVDFAGSSIVTNGVDQTVLLSNNSFGSKIPNSTIEFLFTSEATSQAHLFGTYTGIPEGQLFRLHINTNRNEAYSPGRLCIQIRDNQGNRRREGTVASYNINDGQIHHIALVIENSSNWTLYVDGVEAPLVLTASRYPWRDNLSTFDNFEKELALNANNFGGSLLAFRQGAIDEIRFWEVVRTAQEIQESKDVGLNGDEVGLFNYYKANEGSGDTLFDEVGNSNGTLVGNVDDNMWSEESLLDPTGIKANFAWSAVSGVDGYNVYLSDDGGSTYTKQNTSLITATEFTVEDIADGSYQAYVTSSKNGFESDPSEIVEYAI